MATVNGGPRIQTYRSPPELLQAIVQRFGRIDFDLACSYEDAVAPMGYVHPTYDALERDWAVELAGLTCYGNPPFGLSGEFARAAALSQRKTCDAPPPRVLLLVQASVGSNWFAEYVHDKALVLALSPRVKFVDQPAAINRDLMLCAYGPWQPGFRPWRWQ